MPLGKGFEGCIYRMQVQNIFPLKRVFQDPRPSYISLTPKGKLIRFCLLYLLAHFSDVCFCKSGWRTYWLECWLSLISFPLLFFVQSPILIYLHFYFFSSLWTWCWMTVRKTSHALVRSLMIVRWIQRNTTLCTLVQCYLHAWLKQISFMILHFIQLYTFNYLMALEFSPNMDSTSHQDVTDFSSLLRWCLYIYLIYGSTCVHSRCSQVNHMLICQGSVWHGSAPCC